MSGRGGRGGGRGGRGGGRGGRKDLPWDYDPSVLVSDQPQENYPKTYKPPPASRFPLSGPEKRAIKHFIQLRRDFHNSPLYTHKHMTPDLSASSNITDPVPKSYGQEQRNSRFGVRNKATVDPFLAVPMYSHQFVHEARIVPELKERSFDESLFPEELWPTLAGHDGPSKNKGAAAAAKRKRAADADEDGHDDDDDAAGAARRRRGPETEEERRRRIEEAAQGKDHEEAEAAAEEAELDEEEQELSQGDDDFEDDEDGGDYDAEQYFDDGDGDGMEDDVGESAMDF